MVFFLRGVSHKGGGPRENKIGDLGGFSGTGGTDYDRPAGPGTAMDLTCDLTCALAREALLLRYSLLWVFN